MGHDELHRNRIRKLTALVLALTAVVVFVHDAGTGAGAEEMRPIPPVMPRIDGAARYDDDNRLLPPANLPDWVFLGTSLGMGYSAQPFDASNPGMFQVVLMEPSALAHFERHGRFADGTMFALYFYGSAHRVSTNRAGFVLGGEMGVQIHVVDKARFTDGHAFFDIGVFAEAKPAAALPPGNGCVSCHRDNAAFDGVFAQFYPRLKPRIPAADLHRAMARGTEVPPLLDPH